MPTKKQEPVLSAEEVATIEAMHNHPAAEEIGKAAEAEIEKLVEELKKKPALELCGHVDRHSFGPDGKHDQPACDLAVGHAGDHHGKHQQKVERERFYERETGKLLKIEYDILDVDAWWNDAAGTPVEDIKVGPLPSRNKKSELLQAVEELIKG